MKNILLLLMLLIIGRLSAIAQLEIKASERDQVNTLFKKDTSYSRFHSQLKQLMKTAKGRNSNFAAVKKLFTANKNMLSRIVRDNKIVAVKASDWTISSNIPVVFGALPQNSGNAAKRQTYIAPYEHQFLGGLTMPGNLEEVNSAPSIGKLGYKYDNDEETGNRLGGATITFTHTIPKPNDPLLLTARVEFQYSFTVSGWDSKFADFEIGLYLKCINFTNADFFALPLIVENNQPYFENWRRMQGLLPHVTVENDIETFTKTVEGSFIIDGYIDPTRDMSFRFDAAYDKGGKGGLFGSYHYGEFKLKKIIVSYFHGGN